MYISTHTESMLALHMHHSFSLLLSPSSACSNDSHEFFAVQLTCSLVGHLYSFAFASASVAAFFRNSFLRIFPDWLRQRPLLQL
jgi:hypothetical protein